MSIRDYGMHDIDQVVGFPRVVEQVRNDTANVSCPNCGCESLYLIEIEVSDKLLKGGKGTGRYVGCPACPYASPMVTRATGADQ